MNINPYETDELVAQYMEFHYGNSYFDVKNYPEKCARLCLQLMEKESKQKTERKALDLGCAVGRTSFELAREFDEVIGVDLSARFIECANQLKEKGSLPYNITDEGELSTLHTAQLSDHQLQQIKDKVSFYQEDACNLGAHHQNYELIFAGNLLDRLQNPEQFLSSIHHYLSMDGILVMSSPYTLLAEYTPRENWIGGYSVDEKNITVLEGIKKVLDAHFIMINKPLDVPFVIRETRRKFQHTIAELTSWKRIR